MENTLLDGFRHQPLLCWDSRASPRKSGIRGSEEACRGCWCRQRREEDEDFFEGDVGDVENTLAVVHLRCSIDDGCVVPVPPEVPNLNCYFSGFNFLSHGSQDLYPTYLQQSKNFSAHDATVATIIGNCVGRIFILVSSV